MVLLSAAECIVEELRYLEFSAPVTHVYNPLVYAREPHRCYLERYARPPKEVLLLGMNPGPFGMAQTGIPFGDVTLVRDWLEIRGCVAKPVREHPKRPVLGFDCPRAEVSGTRLWSWARSRFGTPEAFFGRFFVANYCPLCFMEESGKNRTPDKLPIAQRKHLFEACDRALVKCVEYLRPRFVIGVGAFAEKRAREALKEQTPVVVGRILHPSPANPASNLGWAEAAEASLKGLGIVI